MVFRLAFFAIAVIASFIAGTLVPGVSSQRDSQRFLKVQFMKVTPGNGPAYRSLERDLWKPVHQARVDRGLISSWAVYGHHFPGTSGEYQYAVLTAYPSFELLEDSKYPELFEEVQGRQDYDEILKFTSEQREMVRQDLWVLLEHTD